MAYPIIYYDATSGDDLDPSDAVATSTGTSETASYDSDSTIAFSGAVDLSACNQDGSDYIWCDSASGSRHLFQITGIDTGTWSAAEVITVAQAVPAAMSGVDFHVNGSRQTIQDDTSAPDLYQAAAGWIYEFEAGTYVQSVASDIGGMIGSFSYTSPPVTLRAASGAATRPVIDTQVNGAMFGCNDNNDVKAIGLKFTTTSGGGTNTRVQTLGNGSITMVDCVVDCNGVGFGNLYVANYLTSAVCVGCYFTGAIYAPVSAPQANGVSLINCVVDGGDMTYGEPCCNFGDAFVTFIGCLIYDGDGDGIRITGDAQGCYTIINCTIVDHAGDGISVAGSDGLRQTGTIRNNIIAYNGAYGLSSPTSGPDLSHFDIDYNVVYGNTSGAYDGDWSAGANDVTITGDPFSNRAGDDYTLNNTASQGAACREAAWPGTNGWPDGT